VTHRMGAEAIEDLQVLMFRRSHVEPRRLLLDQNKMDAMIEHYSEL
jgi:hypothetical protein